MNDFNCKGRFLACPFGTALLLLLSAQSCGSESHATDWGARVAINNLRAAITVFLQNQGRLPHDLSELCIDVPACSQIPPGGVRDPWGSELAYNVIDAEYELTSPGRDRVLNTSDDITFVPSRERFHVATVAGCYEIHLPWWHAFPGEQVMLDTVPTQTGLYRLLPAVSDREGFWFPQGDSIWLVWLRTPNVTRIVMKLDNAEMHGYWLSSGERSRRGPHNVRVGRIRCTQEPT